MKLCRCGGRRAQLSTLFKTKMPEVKPRRTPNMYRVSRLAPAAGRPLVGSSLGLRAEATSPATHAPCASFLRVPPLAVDSHLRRGSRGARARGDLSWHPRRALARCVRRAMVLHRRADADQGDDAGHDTGALPHSPSVPHSRASTCRPSRAVRTKCIERAHAFERKYDSNE